MMTLLIILQRRHGRRLAPRNSSSLLATVWRRRVISQRATAMPVRKGPAATPHDLPAFPEASRGPCHAFAAPPGYVMVKSDQSRELAGTRHSPC